MDMFRVAVPMKHKGFEEATGAQLFFRNLRLTVHLDSGIVVPFSPRVHGAKKSGCSTITITTTAVT